MGLLNNEAQRNKAIKYLQKHHQKLSIILYLVGLLWFLALAYQPFNAGTYFSENALLPGLVESEIPDRFSRAFDLKNEVKSEITKDKRRTPQLWIYEKLKGLGLDTYRQNFSVFYPFRSMHKKVIQGENVYAILRARRVASTEALVLSVPMRSLANKQKTRTGGSIALAIALAEVFKQKSYWAKDIIFLFTDLDEIGTLAWLDAYHESTSKYIVGEPLEGRSGPIQAAINLELPLEKVGYYNLLLEGLNGQLPNLDLVNLVVRLVLREQGQVVLHHVKPTRYGYYNRGTGQSLEEYQTALTTMLTMMWFQASGAPSGNHGLFHRFHIEALTIEGVKAEKGMRSQDLSTSARIIEGTFRSLNNLLERFHQSFFFYILPGTKRYVSIGMYMPPFGLMAAAGLIAGIALWLNPEEEEKDSKSEAESNNCKEETKADLDSKSSDCLQSDPDTELQKDSEDEQSKNFALPENNEDKAGDDTKELNEDDTPYLFEEEEDIGLGNKGVMSVMPVLLISVLLGWLAYQGPELLTRIMPRFRIHTEDMILYSMLAIYTAALLYPKLMIRKSNNPNRFVLDWRLLKSIGLISQSLGLSCIALTNISQAVFLTVFMVPVTTFVRPSASRWVCRLQMALLVLVSPLMLLVGVGLISAWPQNDLLTLCMETLTSTRELLFLGVMDTYLFNAWTTAIMTAVIFPIWLLFWALPWVQPDNCC